MWEQEVTGVPWSSDICPHSEDSADPLLHPGSAVLTLEQLLSQRLCS